MKNEQAYPRSNSLDCLGSAVAVRSQIRSFFLQAAALLLDTRSSTARPEIASLSTASEGVHLHLTVYGGRIPDQMYSL
jgi:hypothetical protein